MDPIVINSLSRRYGDVLAVDNVSASVRRGSVTGFLGPNGAGKTTLLRMVLGLVAPTSGSATIEGVGYREHPWPMTVVGAALEATGFHPGRTGRGHLRVLAPAARADARQIDSVLELVGLTSAADRRVGGYSLGMKQRLSLASAMLGDPRILVLDEPANGLDPEGIAWLRGFLRDYVGKGGTALISSHVLSEVEQTVDDVLLISAGRLVFSGPLDELGTGARSVTIVRTADAEALEAALVAAGLRVEALLGESGGLTVHADPGQVGAVALAAAVKITELRPIERSLESTFLELVGTGEATAGVVR